jgi:poly-gamma-glutamate capsule biosynthesis protein CapA/YwtB (metallophosphatase superfamily)
MLPLRARRPPQYRHEGFFADPVVGARVLTGAGIAAVGIANNVNYGEAPITASIAALDRAAIAHTGAGADRTEARRPAIVGGGGLRFGFLQRSSVYWPTNHEATDNATGIAVIQAHTAYQVPMHKVRPDIPPMNRPGLPPVILTWADPRYLAALREDIAALRQQVDIVVASFHWGLGREILAYMTEIAHAAIDAGADVVIGHGPHHFLPIEIYRGRPVFYGLGSFSFHTGHGGRRHGDWIGLMAEIDLDGPLLSAARCRFVRHNDRNETVVNPPGAEADAVAEITETSAALGTTILPDGDAMAIDL